MDMLSPCNTVADIGCDHGRLAAALLQSGTAQRVVAADISPASLEKARRLCSLCGLEDSLTLRLGDGLSILSPGEAEGIAILGMGGTLIARLLDATPDVAKHAELVLCPMRAADDLRYYLCHNGYAILDERLVADSRRVYQLIRARAGTPEPPPYGWPEDMYMLGHMLYTRRDPLLPPLVERYIAGHEKRLARAQAAGRCPQRLTGALDALYQIKRLIDEEEV